MSTPTLCILKLPAAYIFQFQPAARAAGIGGLFASTPREPQLEQMFQQQFAHQAALLNRFIFQENIVQAASNAPAPPKRTDGDTHDALLALGRLIYQRLIPNSIQNALAMLPAHSPLVILTNDAALPWELAHDNYEYWALKFQITRQLLSETWSPLPQPAAQTLHDRPLNALLIGNPTEDLPESSTEITQIAELLRTIPQVATCRILMRRRATKENVLAELATGAYQIIHYSGHAQWEPGTAHRSGLLLANQEILTAAEIQRAIGGAPFVFLNGCESAKAESEIRNPLAAETEGAAYMGGAMQGLAAAFGQGGARGVIGSFWPILDAQSRAFALTFYQQILAGQPVAAALQKTRLRSRQNALHNPQWAAYTLLGAAELRIYQPEQQEQRPVTVIHAIFPQLAQIYAENPLVDAAHAEAQLHKLADAVVQRFGGRLVSLRAHAMTAHFGLPRTFEDNAERAVRTALDLLKGLSTLPFAHQLLPQIAICSGDLLCLSHSTLSAPEFTAYGALEAQALAMALACAPGQIVADAETKQQVRAAFHLTPTTLPPVQMGQVQMDQVYELDIEQSELINVPDRAHLAFIGRVQEISALESWWAEARRGQGRLVHIVGQPGIGKSRLLHAFRAQVESAPHLWIETNCRSYDQQRPFALLEQLILTLAQISVDDDESVRRPKLEKWIRETVVGLGVSLDEYYRETLALVGPLIDLAYPFPAIDNLDAPLRMNRLIQIGRALLGYLAQQKPLIWIVDDLQWSDETSLAVLTGLATIVDQIPLLLVTAHRPDWSPGWHSAAHHRHLMLDGLDADGRRALTLQLLEEGTIAEALLADLTAKIGGNPLFLIEVVEALRHNQTLYRDAEGWKLKSALETLVLPQSIEHIVQARMDQLSLDGREVLQHAAIIGPRFRQDVLQEIQQHRDSHELEHRIGELSRREFIRSTFALSTTYIFSHTLIHQAIYDNIVEQFKRALHRLVALALHRLPGEKAIEQLAHHYYFSDDALNAIRFGLMAAERAHRTGANQTALLWSSRVLEKLALLGQPHTEEADEVAEPSVEESTTWRVRALEIQGASHSALGQNDLAIADFKAALAPPICPPWCKPNYGAKRQPTTTRASWSWLGRRWGRIAANCKEQNVRTPGASTPGALFNLDAVRFKTPLPRRRLPLESVE
ncbi:MAG: CHAT domain-containing protein [Caldilineaceae bacterium]